ncbi:MAG: thiamine phosphate synthase [Planctomycetes bacterium]|nr:thiamine phosphate synthase [Planctomycetota bacterium]
MRGMDDAARRYARGLDAGFNRLAEALRTVEDRIRFDRSLPALHARWKELRGDVARLRSLVEERFGTLSLYRDVAGDPGMPPSDRAAEEPARASPDDLLAANLARAREAARSIEESLRAALPELSGQAERLRYAVYAAEAVAAGLIRRAHRLQGARLYVLLTECLATMPWFDAARAALRGGAQALQLREKDLPAGEFLRRARLLRELTAEHGALLIVNDRVEVAALAGADGVHLGQEDLPAYEARKLLGPDALIGVSTHAPEQARRAESDGADYIGVGPIYATRTKEHRAAAGLGYIAAAAAATELPGFAIGGVNRETLPAVIAAGARRAAVCTGIIGARDIEEAARWCRARLVEA